MTRYKPRKRSR